MTEGRCRRRVGQVVSRHVHGLDRGNRSDLGRDNALLQFAHFFGQRRLISHRRWHTAKQRRYFGSCQSEAIDIVDEEQDVTAFVTEFFGHGQTGQCHAQTVARRLVHLPEHHRHFGLANVVELDDAGFGHLVVEVVALSSALSDAGEHRQAGVLLCDVVDQLEHVHGLADTGTAE